ncbi:hypothetical protein ANO11243_087170 [Dothideomycetidae sp. 11243]|nr:hypothetical protein ANO11243_087170 [fungal sp. No.11243]
MLVEEKPISLEAVESEVASYDNTSSSTIVESTYEERLIRKVDLHLILPLWCMFLVSFMDRINLGNVVVLGMPKDLHLQGHQYNVVLQSFFITYLLFDIPSNIFLKRSRPSYFLSALSFFWGVSSLCQGLVKGFAGLLICRLFLGAFEAGAMPACIYMTSMYYKRHELQFRFNILWTAGIAAGCVSGLLAYAIDHLGGVGGLAGWRWILVLDGLLACILSLLAVFVLADWPHQARFFTASEKAFWARRTQGEAQDLASMERLDKAAVSRILRDWKIWCGAFIYLGIGTSGYSAALFVPSILRSLGYSGIQSQVQSIPIWAVATVSAVMTGFISDRVKHRYGFIMFGLCVATTGYAILLGQGASPSSRELDLGLPLAARHLAVFLAVGGTHIAQPVILIWLANNLCGSYKRGVGAAIQILFGSIAGIVSSNSFVSEDAPRYFAGYGTVIGLLFMSGALSTVFALGLIWENRKRERGERDYRLLLRDEERTNLGDDHPSFRFTL